MFDDRDFHNSYANDYPSMFDLDDPALAATVAATTTSSSAADSTFKAHQLMLDDSNTFAAFSESNTSSYPMEPTTSNSSASSSSYASSTSLLDLSSAPSSAHHSHSNSQSHLSLDFDLSEYTNDAFTQWPMHPHEESSHPMQRSVSMAQLYDAPAFDPYTPALTPPSDSDYSGLLTTATVSPQTSFYDQRSTLLQNQAAPAAAATQTSMQHQHQQAQRQQQQQQQQQMFTNLSMAPEMIRVNNFPSSPPDTTGFSDHPTSSSSPATPTTKPAFIPQTYTKWVKLTRMTPDRIEQIKQLANVKGIDAETVESVLKLYSETRPREDNEVNRYSGEDVYIKITMGTSAQLNDETAESQQIRRRRSDGSIMITKKKHRKQRPNHVKRPLNSFMLYRKSQTQSAMAYALSSKLKLNHQNISQIIGLMWQTESKELKDEFAKFAGQEKELHRAMHPDYKFCPQKKVKKPVA